MNNIRPAHIVVIFLVFLAYYATAKFGLSLEAVSGFATLVWAPTGIALAAHVLFGKKVLPAIFLSAFLVNFETGAPFFVAMGIALGNMLEAIVGRYILKGVGFDNNLKRLRDVLALVLTAFSSTVVSATFGVTSLWLGGVIPVADYTQTWIAWWMGDILGALVITPLLLVWIPFPKSSINSIKRSWELLFFTLVLDATLIIVFSGLIVSEMKDRSLAYMLFVPLIWSAIRFGQRGTITIIALISVVAVWSTSLNLSPFYGKTLLESLFSLQLFIGTISIPMLVLAATIEERKIAQNDLEEQREELTKTYVQDEALLSSIGDGILVINTNHQITHLNHAAEKLLGHVNAETIGKPYSEVVQLTAESGQPPSLTERPYYKAIEERKVVKSQDYYCTRQDGSKFAVSITAAPIFIGEKIYGVIDVLRDITEEKQLEQRKSEFISMAAHQLRTPLGIIRWNTELLLRGLKKPSFKLKAENLDQTYQSIIRMTRLIDDLLSASRLEAGKIKDSPTKFAVTPAIQTIIADLKKEADEKHVTINLSDNSASSELFLDQTHFYTVMQNLIANSLNYNRPHGKIDIEVDSTRSHVVITIKDTGIGIPIKDQGTIFNKFYRGTNARDQDVVGTGLGLFIVKSFVSSWGGTINFESVENEGTTFKISLPKSA